VKYGETGHGKGKFWHPAMW